MSLVITGNPGVGKHTIAEKLAKKMKLEILDINKIAIESGIGEPSNGTLDVDVIKLKSILKKKLTKKLLLVGHLAPYVIPKTKVRFVIVLRKNPYQLIPVYKKRKYSSSKIADNVGSEILGVTAFDSIKKFGKSKTYQIDTTAKTPLKIIRIIEKIFEGKFEGDKVDWLSLVSEKKDLKKFFSY